MAQDSGTASSASQEPYQIQRRLVKVLMDATAVSAQWANVPSASRQRISVKDSSFCQMSIADYMSEYRYLTDRIAANLENYMQIAAPTAAKIVEYSQRETTHSRGEEYSRNVRHRNIFGDHKMMRDEIIVFNRIQSGSKDADKILFELFVAFTQLLALKEGGRCQSDARM
ncbi:MAG: hypothetical protein M0R33_17080 [Methylomonas sp.]|jgi:hypothetical protein|uniref:hypothetical protein n=1 Tax=Methylomonas sp. TaxID=418 RepID=UPI0025E99A48|nr:hypothetical protein [Methylomonas sp.]MCK9608160.1 hypothetical protein [Methylomonas sp.]